MDESWMSFLRASIRRAVYGADCICAIAARHVQCWRVSRFRDAVGGAVHDEGK